MNTSYPKISAVVPGSIADEVGISAGFSLVAINGESICDILDYRFVLANEELVLTMLTADNEPWEIEIEKEFGEDIGLVFEQPTIDQLKACRNNCLFCFVAQQPPGMRQTLVIKDDDYRLSALSGSFVTLTNLTPEEWQRILDQRLSPLYISVHTTNGELRAEMMKNPQAANILDQLRTLAQHNIEIHCQLVLVPGVNDGRELERSVNDLLSLWPAVQSVAVVPVGLTKHRESLAELGQFTKSRSRQVIDYLLPFARRVRRKLGVSFVYLADEFFVLAESNVPDRRYYDDFPQIENGVGLIRKFLDGATSCLKRLPRRLSKARQVIWVTGTSAAPTLMALAHRLNSVEGLWIDVLPVLNQTFGKTVTVAGLLAGQDVIQALKQVETKGRTILIPDILVRSNEQDFLDDLSFGDLVRMFAEAEICLTPTNGEALVSYTLGEGVN